MSQIFPTSTAANVPERMSRDLSRLAILLALSIFINYVDRGNLSIAAPLVKNELGLSYAQMGAVFAAFFVTYAIFQIVCGSLLDYISANWLLALGIMLWSAATLATGLVHGFYLLLAMRLILGIGESVAYPSYSKIISQGFSESQRGRANSFVCAGQASGPAFGTFLGGLLMPKIGWRLFFVVLGIASSLWLLPWLKYFRKTPLRNPPAHATPAAPSSQMHHEFSAKSATQFPRSASVLQILQRRSAWGTFGGLFAYNYVWYFFITWLPTYLVNERHFSLQKMSFFTTLMFLVLAASALLCGWLSDKWIAAGASPTLVRKTFTGVGPLIAASILVVGIVESHDLAMAVLVLVCIGMGMCTSNLWAVTQTLAGPATSGKWTGLENFTGNVAGWIAPALIGFIVQRAGSFFWVFVITGCVSLLGSISWLFVVGPLHPIDWQAQRSDESPSF